MDAPRKFLVLLTALMLLFVSACGTTAPDTAPIPTFSGATEVSGDESVMAATLKDSLEQQQEAQGFNADSAVYTLPAGTAFESIEEFYNTELTGRGWTKQEDMSSVAGVNMAGWSRGNDQAFVVAVINDPMTGADLLMTMQATR